MEGTGSIVKKISSDLASVIYIMAGNMIVNIGFFFFSLLNLFWR